MTSSSVPRSSPSAAARLSMPTGPPSKRSMIVVQQLAIERVEALRIDLEQVERGVGHRLVDAPVGRTCA